MKKHKIEARDEQKGFSPNGKIFLTRLQSIEFLRKYDPSIYKAVMPEAAEGLHTHMYAKAKGVELKHIDISKKNILVIDRGLYTYIAEALGKKANHVWYYVQDSNPYPDSPKSQIGTGLDTIERVYSPYEFINRADSIIFPDCYDSEWQIDLRSRGHNVFGGHGSEKFELDKEFFFQFLIDNGMNIPPTFKIKGLDNIIEYLQDKEDKWIKQSFFRGDFETKHHVDKNHSKSWFDDLRKKLGARSENIKVLIQDPIKKAFEVGIDTFCLNGEYAENPMVGYEIKDRGLVCKIYNKIPKIMTDINSKFSEAFKELGYYGQFSNEVRIEDDGTAYPIDWTVRVPSPPGELMTLQYTNYAEIVDSLACGELEEPEYKDEYGATLMLYSPWNECHELCVEYPKEYEENVKLKNHIKKDDHHIIVENGNGGYFGAVCATGKTRQEAQDKCLEIIGTVKAYQLDFSCKTFDEADEEIEKGTAHNLGL
jgi:hypothetical protein